MDGMEIRDDRAAGRLEAVVDGEVVGRIEYFVLDDPAPALVPVHTVVEPAHEGRASPAPSPASSTPWPPVPAPWSRRCARTSSGGPRVTPTRHRRPTRSCCARRSSGWRSIRSGSDASPPGTSGASGIPSRAPAGRAVVTRAGECGQGRRVGGE